MEINEAYKPFQSDESRYVLLMGGAGSGKSHAAAQKVILRCLGQKGTKFLVVRKVGRNLKSSVYDELATVISMNKLDKYFTLITSPLKITCNINGNEINFTGIDDPEKIKSISAVTDMWIEEATEISMKDWTQLKLRIRGQSENYKQYILSFNPISARHWIKKHFFDEKQNNVSIYRSNYLDNAFLDPDDIDEITGLINTDENAYKVYALGEWGVVSDAVIYDANKWTVTEISQDYDDYNDVSVGVDFAYVNPSGVVVIATDKDNNLFILQEIYQKRLTNMDLINKIKLEIPKWKELLFYVDEAEQDRKEEFIREGIRVRSSKKGQGSVKIGIDFLKRRHIYIHPTCTNFIDEISGYSYKTDARTDDIFDTPNKVNDHLMDCMRYAISDLIHRNNILILPRII